MAPPSILLDQIKDQISIKSVNILPGGHQVWFFDLDIRRDLSIRQILMVITRYTNQSLLADLQPVV